MQRPDLLRGAELDPKSMLIYGLDLLNEKEVKEMLPAVGDATEPPQIKWMNDSLCMSSSTRGCYVSCCTLVADAHSSGPS